VRKGEGGSGALGNGAVVKKLDFYLTDILLYTLKRTQVQKVFINEAMEFGWERHEAKEMYDETFKILARHFQNAKI